MSFSPKQIADLEIGRQEIDEKFVELRQRLVLTEFRTAGAREHSDHGLARRLGTLTRCIDRVWELLPPSQIAIPDSQNTTDATLHIQAFVLNAFGCCENLAWIWVNERGVMDRDGQPLPTKFVGLGPGYGQVRKSFSKDFQAYLREFDNWFANLKDFRDALAHRIPLYIPPFCIDPARGDEFQNLDAQANAALMRGDLEIYVEFCAQRDNLRHFTPVMIHSLTDARQVVFHYQLQADFNTVVDLIEHMLAELEALAL